MQKEDVENIVEYGMSETRTHDYEISYIGTDIEKAHLITDRKCRQRDNRKKQARVGRPLGQAMKKCKPAYLEKIRDLMIENPGGVKAGAIIKASGKNADVNIILHACEPWLLVYIDDLGTEGKKKLYHYAGGIDEDEGIS